MRATEIIEHAKKEGVRLTVSGDDLDVDGDSDAVCRWLPVLREHKKQVISVLNDPPAYVTIETCGNNFVMATSKELGRPNTKDIFLDDDEVACLIGVGEPLPHEMVNAIALVKKAFVDAKVIDIQKMDDGQVIDGDPP